MLLLPNNTITWKKKNKHANGFSLLSYNASFCSLAFLLFDFIRAPFSLVSYEYN